MTSPIIVSQARPSAAPLVLFLLFLLAVFARTAMANPVTIQDASFDTRSLSSGSTSTTLTPWQETGGTGNVNGWIGRLSGFTANGVNHLGMNLNHNVWQDLGVTYQANMRYTLTVAVGNRSSFTNVANQSRYILAASDGTVFATGTLNASTIPVGTFADAPALVLETGGISPANGKTIRILLQAGGSGRSHFDNIRLTAVSTVLAQTITFGELAPLTAGDPPVLLGATSSSGLAVSYSSSDPDVASLSGNLLTAHAEGTVTITASQTGGVDHLPAPPVERTLVVNSASGGLSFNPSSLAITVRSGETGTTPLTLENSTGGQIDWRLLALDAQGRASGLEGQLDAIINSGDTLNGPLPLRFDFTGGEAGTTSLNGNPSGTTGILSQGNRLLTNLGGPLAYTNDSVAASTLLGPQGRYFTRKLPGLFVFGAETDGIEWFEVAGSLTYGNTKQSTAFRVQHNGRWWSAFVVNHVDYWKTINHLVLVDQEGLQQTLGNSSSQQQRITGLGGKRRIYHFLYITTSTVVQPQSVFEALASRFLGLLPEFGSRMTFDPTDGSSPASGGGASTAGFDAFGMAEGTYLGTARALAPAGGALASAPVSVTVTAPRIQVPALVEREMFPGQVPQTLELPLTSNLPEAQPWTAVLSSPAAWLTIESPSGTTPEPLRLRLDPAGLATGLYSTVVTVSSGPAAYQIPVSLRVRELAIGKLVADPARPLVYALHKNGLNEGTLLVINSITRRILHAVPTGKEPTDCDLSEDGSKLWVINSKGPSLTAVSTSTWQVIETIPLTQFTTRDRSAGNPGAHVKCGKGSIIYYVDDQWGPRLRVFDTATRTVLQTFSAESGTSPDTSNNFGYGDIALNPQRTRLFGWRQYGDSAGVTGSHIVRFDIKPDGMLEKFTKSANINTSNFDRVPYDTPVIFSRDGTRLIIKDRVVDQNNLDAHPILYPDEIYSITPGGEISVGSTAIYAGEGGEILHNLPVTSTVQTILPDYSAWVHFNSTTKSLGWLDLPATLGPATLGLELTPADGSTVAQPSRLKWLPVTGITRYQVYLGTSRTDVENATTSSAFYLGMANGNEIALAGELALGQTYYWRVVPVGADDVPLGGSTIYSFSVSGMTFSRSSIAAETVQGVTTHLETIQLESAVPQSWTATESTAWIKSATAAGSTPGAMTIEIDASALAAGLYQGSVTVTSAGSQVVVPVSLRVYAPNFVIADADLDKPYVYLVSQTDVNSTQPSFLLRLNTATDKIESAIPCGTGVTDLAVHYLENRIYLTNWKTGVLRAFDRTTFAQVQTYQFAPVGDTGYGEGGIWRVSAGKAGRLILEESDQWIDIRLINTANGAVLATQSSEYAGDGEADPLGRYYYHSEMLSSTDSLTRYDLSADTFVRMQPTGNASAGTVVMIPDGSRLAVGPKVFDPGLVLQFTLPANVLAATLHGDLMFTSNKAYNGVTGLEMATLPANTTVMSVSGDQKKLYQFPANSAAFQTVALGTIAPLPSRSLTPAIADGATVIGTTQELGWSIEPVALSYDVYFGTSAAAVAAATKTSPEFLGNVTGTRWTGALPALTLGGGYFWRVDLNGFSSVTKGSVWSFQVSPVDVTPRRVELAVPAGAPVPRQSLALTSAMPRAWTASSSTPWITVVTPSGTTPDSLRFDINTSGLTVGTKSGSITVQSGGSTFSIPVELSIVTLNVTRLVPHPQRPVVYAINTALTGEGFSQVLELDAATAAIQRTLPIGFAPTDADLDAATGRLYISNWGYDQTRVVDVDAWRELPPLNLGTDVYKLEITPNGRLITEGEDQWIDVDMWNVATGTKLATQSEREGDGQADPTGSYYYHTDNNSSGAVVTKFDIRSNSFVTAVTGPQIGYGSRNLILSEDGSRLFWLGRVMDKDLALLGQMPDEVHATNRTGDLAVGPAAVWWSDSATEVAKLPFSSTVAAFSSGDTHLLRFNATTRTLHSIAVSTLTDLPGPWPRPGQVVQESPARFSWTPVAGATSYRIFIAADVTALQAMSSPTATVASAEYLPTTALDFGRFYSWRVDAVTGSGVITGKVNSFGIEFPAGPALPQFDNGSNGIAASLSDRHLLVGINGSAQLYNFDPANGQASPIQKFTLPGYYGDHNFGAAVAMDAGKASVGAYTQGSAYVFRPGTFGYWESSGLITPPSPVSNEGFGRGLAASGNLMLVGTQGTTNSAGRVCAYLTEPEAILTQTFSASDAVSNDGFGRVIAMEGNLAVISSPGNGSSYNRLPCLYAFSRSISTGLWTQTQKITIPGASTFDSSGRALSLSGSTLATTSGNNAIIIYTRNTSGQWVQSATINRSAIPNSSASFGGGLALAGDQLFIGDPSASHNGTSGGAVFSFRRSGTSWIAGPVIAPSGSRSGFGAALSVRDHWLAVAGGSSQPAWIYQVGTRENRTPRFIPGMPTQVVAGRAFSTPVTAEDADGNGGLLIDKLQGPAWFSVTDNGNGQALLVGTPAGTSGAIHTVQLRVRDNAGAEALHAYQLSLLSPTDLPVLNSSPLATDLGVGQELILRASVSGIGPFKWQWFKDGQAIDGATGSTYIIGEVGLENSGQYHVRVSNVVGPVESAAVAVNVRPADRYAGDWPTFGGSPAHTGRHPAALYETHFLPAWNAEVQAGYALNRAAIANGRAVVVPQSRFATGISVKGLDLKTGTALWSFPVPSSNSTNPPTIYQDKVYFQRGKGTGGGDTPQLYGLNAATGQQFWVSTFGAQWETYEAPAVGDAGIFINGGTYGGMYGFNFDGSQRFYQGLAQYDRWTPTLANGRLFSWVGGGTGAAFTEHNSSDGVALWSIQPGSGQNAYSMNSISAVSGNTAVIISTSEVVCIDLSTRAIRWRVPGIYRGSPGIADGRVFAIQGNAVRSYSLADGMPDLVYQTDATGSTLVDQPILFNDRLVISSETKTWIFKLEDAALLQTLDAGGRLSYSEGYLLAAGSDGTLRAFAALNYNPKLASLELSPVGFLPEFDKLRTRYIATVPFDTETVTIKPATEFPKATVKINGVPSPNGSASAPVPLQVGENEIPILVTAEDGITTMTYTIAVTRLPQNFVFNSSADIPLTANGFLTGVYPVNVILNHHPVPGTSLTMVNNTGRGFIHGRFGNLAHGQRITLQHNGVDYDFVANYHGGTGNDLVLHWADTFAVAWGQNNQGQLGDGTTVNASTPVSVEPPEGVLVNKTIFALSAGYLHSLALLHDGTMASWGYNVQGQLGLGHQNASHLATQVDKTGALAGKTVIAIAAGAFHNLALCDDGTIVSWGMNQHGQLGTGDRQMRTAPAPVEPLGALAGKRVVAIAAGFYHSLALCDDGAVVGWGYNDEGELGDGTATTALVPVAVDVTGELVGKSVSRVSAGQYHNLALCTDGTLVAWGYNARGQLGDGSTTDRRSPARVVLTGVAAGGSIQNISAGGSHSLARLADGTLVGWGDNARGQLDPAAGSRLTVPQILSSAPGSGFSAGAGHTLNQRNAETIDVWGDARAASSSVITLAGDAFYEGSRFVSAATSATAFHSLAIVALPSQVGVPVTTLADWRDQHFGTTSSEGEAADCHDCDGDGIPNLVEYAFGFDPRALCGGKLPVPQRIGDRFELRFSITPAAPDIEYGAEWSPDLSPGSWRDVPDSGSGDEHLFSLPVDTSPTLFMRLRVRADPAP